MNKDGSRASIAILQRRKTTATSTYRVNREHFMAKINFMLMNELIPSFRVFKMLYYFPCSPLFTPKDKIS